MLIPQNTMVAVVDGENFNLYRNVGNPNDLRLEAVSPPETQDRTSDSGRSSSSGNPADKQMEEDAFGKGVTETLNKLVLDGDINELVIIAAPRSLGEMRRSYHGKLQEALIGEVDKVLTSASISDIEDTLNKA